MMLVLKAGRAGAAFLLVAYCLGCSNETVKAPATQKLTGAVVTKEGKPFTREGTIDFRHETNPDFTSLGQIGADGKFTLRTLAGNQQNLEGVPEGEYTVTIVPKVNDKGESNSITLSKKYSIKKGDTSITVTLEQ